MNEKRKAEDRPQSPDTNETLSDIVKEEIGIKETQRADIERRRQEELDNSVLSDGEIELLKQGASENEIANYQSDNYMHRDGKGAIKEFNEINAKYDAEIDALESKTTTPESNDIITEEIPLFGNKVPETKGARVRKRPKKGGVTNTALDSQQSSEMTTEQIQEEINRQKEYQKKNCPEIKP